MKSNADKCRTLVSFNEKVKIKIGSHKIGISKREKCLGVHLDGELSFDYHMSEISKIASRKVPALARVTSSMSLSEKPTLKNKFSKSQFDYCPPVFLFHSFITFLVKDGSASIHEWNVKILEQKF